MPDNVYVYMKFPCYKKVVEVCLAFFVLFPAPSVAGRFLKTKGGRLSLVCKLSESGKDAGKSTDNKVADKKFTLKVIFKEAESRRPIAGMEVTLTNLRTQNTTVGASNEDGIFLLEIGEESLFSLSAYKVGYFLSEGLRFSSIGRVNASTILFEMDVRRIETGQTYVWENLVFRINDSVLEADSKPALLDFFKLLKLNPELRFEIGCHTDARGDDAYNQKISEERAQNLVQKLCEMGISPDRLVAKGYGESAPLNHCTNGVRCSQAQHNQNRRVSLKVL